MASPMPKACEQIVFSLRHKSGKSWGLNTRVLFKKILQLKMCVNKAIFNQNSHLFRTAFSTPKIGQNNLLDATYPPNPHYLLLTLSIKI